MTTKEQYIKLTDKIYKRYPNTKIKYKNEHWLWKRLPTKIKLAGTTMSKNTIWMPDRKPRFRMLAHEYQHLVDWNSMGTFGFGVMYLSPQITSIVLIALAFVALMFGLKLFALIMGIMGLIFLLPWPSRGRRYLEMKGYLMSMYIVAITNLDISAYRHYLVDVFTSWLYYKMVWTRSRASELILEAAETIDDKEAIANTSVAFKDVYEILTEIE